MGAGSSAAGANKGARRRERSLLPRRAFGRGAAVPRGGQDRPGSPVLQGPRERALRARNTAGAVDPRLQRAFQPVVREPRGGRASERGSVLALRHLPPPFFLGGGEPYGDLTGFAGNQPKEFPICFPARHPGRGGAGQGGRMDGWTEPLSGPQHKEPTTRRDDAGSPAGRVPTSPDQLAGRKQRQHFSSWKGPWSELGKRQLPTLFIFPPP